MRITWLILRLTFSEKCLGPWPLSPLLLAILLFMSTYGSNAHALTPFEKVQLDRLEDTLETQCDKIIDLEKRLLKVENEYSVISLNYDLVTKTLKAIYFEENNETEYEQLEARQDRWEERSSEALGKIVNLKRNLKTVESDKKKTKKRMKDLVAPPPDFPDTPDTPKEISDLKADQRNIGTDIVEAGAGIKLLEGSMNDLEIENKEVTDLLKKLRSESGLPVDIEAPFLSVENNFFTEIGAGIPLNMGDAVATPFQQYFTPDGDISHSVAVGVEFNKQRFEIMNVPVTPQIMLEYGGGGGSVNLLRNIGLPGTLTASGDIDYSYYLVSGGLNFQLAEKVVWGIDGGIGVGRQELNNVITAGVQWLGDDTGLAFRFGTQLRYRLSPHSDVGIKLSYLEMSDINGRLSAGPTFKMSGLDRLEAMFTLRFYLHPRLKFAD